MFSEEGRVGGYAINKSGSLRTVVEPREAEPNFLVEYNGRRKHLKVPSLNPSFFFSPNDTTHRQFQGIALNHAEKAVMALALCPSRRMGGETCSPASWSERLVNPSLRHRRPIKSRRTEL